MAAAGGAASIITQVQQGGPAPVNNLSGNLPACWQRFHVGLSLISDATDVAGDEHITLDLR